LLIFIWIYPLPFERRYGNQDLHPDGIPRANTRKHITAKNANAARDAAAGLAGSASNFHERPKYSKDGVASFINQSSTYIILRCPFL
jgi:hypothetical protein